MTKMTGMMSDGPRDHVALSNHLKTMPRMVYTHYSADQAGMDRFRRWLLSRAGERDGNDRAPVEVLLMRSGVLVEVSWRYTSDWAHDELNGPAEELITMGRLTRSANACLG